MNSKQTIVLWMGLLLITLRFFTSGQWKTVWSTVMKGQPSNGGNSILGVVPGLGFVVNAPNSPSTTTPPKSASKPSTIISV